MAKAKRKSGGPLRGKFKRKKMGKGYAAARVRTTPALPIDRTKEAAEKRSDKEAERAASGGKRG